MEAKNMWEKTTLLHPAVHAWLYPANHFLSAPCHFPWPSLSHRLWHFIREPLTHIIKNNLYCPFTLSSNLDTGTSQTGGCSPKPNVTDCQCLYGMQCKEGRVKHYFRRIHFSPSPSVLLVWQQLAQGSSPSLCFRPSAHSALPKVQCSSSTTQSSQTPTGGRQVCISARQFSVQQSAEWSDSKWKVFHNPPKTASYLCSMADTLKPKIDWMSYFFFLLHPFTANLCNNCIAWICPSDLPYPL